MFHLSPADVWGMALEDFEMFAGVADGRIAESRRNAARHAR